VKKIKFYDKFTTVLLILFATELTDQGHHLLTMDLNVNTVVEYNVSARTTLMVISNVFHGRGEEFILWLYLMHFSI